MPPPSDLDADGRARLEAEVATVLAREGLGRSQMLEAMLRYLAARALEGSAPKEIEIADAVFGRLADAGGDSSVRVYLHRLRRKLAEFYEGAGSDCEWRLALPKGSYLLQVVAARPGDELIGDANPPVSPSQVSRPRIFVLAAVLLVLLGGALGWFAARAGDGPAQIATLQKSPFWQPLLSGNRRVVLAVGDYYIFGERGPDGEITRLVREFDVNSARDLDSYKAMGVPGAQNYADLGLDYLPIGLARALVAVAPVLGGGRDGLTGLTTVPASQLDPAMLSGSSVIYLGYLSGLAGMRDALFRGSRFGIGASYDEIVDRASGRHYLASSHLDSNGAAGEDYALVSAFAGPGGSRALVIAGTRDAALMGAAEFVTRPDRLAELEAKADGDFDALLAVDAVHGVALEAHIIAVAKRGAVPGEQTQFPDEMPNANLVKY